MSRLTCSTGFLLHSAWSGAALRLTIRVSRTSPGSITRSPPGPGSVFFGNVCFGSDVTRADLQRHYHQIFYATGAQTDRSLGIPGEDLHGSHSATEFVAWYNGHPDYRHLEFDLSAKSVVVIGVGNVAIDVARILCRTPAELSATDIADHALERLRESQVREVHVLGRRGPLQAAFTPPEVKELGTLEGADAIVRPEEATLDPLSEEALASAGRSTRRNVEIVQGFAERSPSGKPKGLHIRFLVSPTEIIGDEAGRVSAIRVVHNELHRSEKRTSAPARHRSFRNDSRRTDLSIRRISGRPADRRSL